MTPTTPKAPQHTYTLEAGRSILRDGKRFATIGRSVVEITKEGPNPSDVDEFARLCAVAPELYEALRHIAEMADFPTRDGAGNRANLLAAKAQARAVLAKVTP